MLDEVVFLLGKAYAVFAPMWAPVFSSRSSAGCVRRTKNGSPSFGL